MLFAIDTSTLIVLQKLGWLNLCRQSDNKFIRYYAMNETITLPPRYVMISKL